MSSLTGSLPPNVRAEALDIRRLIRAAQERLDEAERGWRPIGHGDETDLSIAVPVGVARVRVAWRGSALGTSDLGMRVNGESTTGLHTRSWTRTSPSLASPAYVDGQSSSMWFVGNFLSTLPSWGSFEVDCATAQPKMSALAHQAGIPSGTQRFIGYGSLSADRSVTSLSMLPNGSTFSTFGWEAEGYYS